MDSPLTKGGRAKNSLCHREATRSTEKDGLGDVTGVQTGAFCGCTTATHCWAGAPGPLQPSWRGRSTVLQAQPVLSLRLSPNAQGPGWLVSPPAHSLKLPRTPHCHYLPCHHYLLPTTQNTKA